MDFERVRLNLEKLKYTQDVKDPEADRIECRKDRKEQNEVVFKKF